MTAPDPRLIAVANAGVNLSKEHEIWLARYDAIRAFDEQRLRPTPMDPLGDAALPPSEAVVDAALEAWYRAARALPSFSSQEQMRAALIAAAKARTGG